MNILNGQAARRALLATVVAASALAYTSWSVLAHDGATGIVKERMDLMSELGDSMKLLTNMIKKKVPFDAEQVERTAASMTYHATRMPELFPDSVDSRSSKHSEALPVVWERWEDFERGAAELRNASEALGQAAATGDEKDTRKQIITTAKTCKGCHTDYRKPKN